MVRGVLDRVEEELAVIVLDRGGEIIIPLEQLPEGSKENTVFDIDFRINLEEEKKRLDEIKRIQEKINKRSQGENT